MNSFAPMMYRSVLVGLMLMSTAARAESAAVEVYARTALVWMQVGVRHEANTRNIKASKVVCIQGFAPSQLYQVVTEIMDASLTPTEHRAADLFFESATGKKFARYGMLQAYSNVGEKTPEPMPAFSDTETYELQVFSATSAGNKLALNHIMTSAFAKEKYVNRVRELVAQCEAKH